MPKQPASIGHVTSSYRGAVLALVEAGRARLGQTLHVRIGRKAIAVSVVDPVFIDKTGTRLRPQPVAPASAWPLLPAATLPTPAVLSGTAVRIAALAPTTLLSIRAGVVAATGIGMALGVLLPTVPCRSVIARNRAALWLGPDEWLIQAPQSAHGLAALAQEATSEYPASVVDVSCRTLALEIAGPHAAWCLNGFCALDLETKAFPVGMCTRTLLGKAEIVLWRIAPDVFRLDVARSLFPYVWQCLETTWTAVNRPHSAGGACVSPYRT